MLKTGRYLTRLMNRIVSLVMHIRVSTMMIIKGNHMLRKRIVSNQTAL